MSGSPHSLFSGKLQNFLLMPFAAINPITKVTRNITRNTKKMTRAIPAKVDAINSKPKSPAMRAITNEMTAS